MTTTIMIIGIILIIMKLMIIIKIMMIRITVEVHPLDRRGDPVKSSGIFSSKHTIIMKLYWQFLFTALTMHVILFVVTEKV